MGKYDPLKAFLISSDAEEVVLGFEEIEALLGTPLPPSKRHPAWWSNNPSNNTMTRVWLAAGYRTERLDIEGRRIVFRRSPNSTQVSGGVIERLQAALGGTVRLAPGVDLTEPTGEVWDAQEP
jgi:hypothetical protein